MNKKEKIAELKAEIKILKERAKKEEQKQQKIFVESLKFEGKYGKIVHSAWDDGQGLRGYHYEYENEELREKEKQERQQFLKDNNYLSNKDFYEKYEKVITEKLEELCVLQYGMTREEKCILDNIKRLQKEIKKNIERIEEYQKELDEIKKCND